MRKVLSVCLILALSVFFFEVLIRLLGKNRIDELSLLFKKSEAHTVSIEALAYKDWFFKNYNQDLLKRWEQSWIATRHSMLSGSLRHSPRLDHPDNVMVYLPGTRNFALRSLEEKILRQAVVKIDEDGFRRTILPETVDTSTGYLFMGDSYTFGYGLNDDETFCSKFAEMNHAFVKNAGIIFSGPNDLLSLFRDQARQKLPEISSKVIRVIYTFNMHYFERAFLASDKATESELHFYAVKPYYREKNGKLEYQGKIGDQNLLVGMYKLYNLSAANTVLKYSIHPDWTDMSGEMALFFKELNDFLVLRYPNSKVEFYVSPFPFRHNLPNSKFLDELNRMGINTISFARTPIDDILSVESMTLLAVDKHPSPMSALLYAKMLTDYFKHQ